MLNHLLVEDLLHDNLYALPGLHVPLYGLLKFLLFGQVYLLTLPTTYQMLLITLNLYNFSCVFPLRDIDVVYDGYERRNCGACALSASTMATIIPEVCGDAVLYCGTHNPCATTIRVRRLEAELSA
jgi:hypothetical protein